MLTEDNKLGLMWEISKPECYIILKLIMGRRVEEH